VKREEAFGFSLFSCVTIHSPVKDGDMISTNVSEAEPLPLSCITQFVCTTPFRKSFVEIIMPNS